MHVHYCKQPLTVSTGLMRGLARRAYKQRGLIKIHSALIGFLIRFQNVMIKFISTQARWELTSGGALFRYIYCIYIFLFTGKWAYARNCGYRPQFNNNNNDDDVEEVAHPLSGSSSTWFQVKLEFGNVYSTAEFNDVKTVKHTSWCSYWVFIGGHDELPWAANVGGVEDTVPL